MTAHMSKVTGQTIICHMSGHFSILITSTNLSILGYKLRPVIDHFNEAFQSARSDGPRQAIDEHMTKFKGHHSAKQYLKNKPIKWGFKWWCRACSDTGYLYEFQLYLGKNESPEYGLGESVVLSLSEKLRNTYCCLYFDNFFSSPTLINKLYGMGIYAVSTVRRDRKNMPILKEDKAMERGDVDFHFSDNVTAMKWFDNKSVTLVATNLEGSAALSNVHRRKKGQKNKVPIPCPEAVKQYNAGMGGVDLMDQKCAAYHLDRKSSSGRYYLRLFFDIMDMACVNAHVIYKDLNPKGMELLDFKQVISKNMIGHYNCRQRNQADMRASRRSFTPASVPLHLPIIDGQRGKCKYCYDAGIENKTSIKCATCGVRLCIVVGKTERNCFYLYHR